MAAADRVAERIAKGPARPYKHGPGHRSPAHGAADRTCPCQREIQEGYLYLTDFPDWPN